MGVWVMIMLVMIMVMINDQVDRDDHDDQVDGHLDQTRPHLSSSVIGKYADDEDGQDSGHGDYFGDVDKDYYVQCRGVEHPVMFLLKLM